MARVVFSTDSPVQALSGSYCGATYRTLPSGRTVVHIKMPYDPGKARKRPDYIVSPERAKYVTEQCTWALQKEVGDMQEAIKRRRAIDMQVQRIYKNVNVAIFPNDDELIKQILLAYRNANTGHNLPSRHKSEKCALL